MSVSEIIPVETVNEDKDQNVHENAVDEEDNEPPPLRAKKVLKQDQASIGILLI